MESEEGEDLKFLISGRTYNTPAVYAHVCSFNTLIVDI